MNIQSASNPGSSMPAWVSNFSAKVAEHPILVTSDVVDLGAGLANSTSAVSGLGGDVLKGTGIVMAAYHGIKGITHLARATESYDSGYSKHHFTMLAGEALTTTGHICASAGVGPVSLGFLGLGLAVTNLADFNSRY